MDVCVLSGRGLCDGLITSPEESYRLWCVVVCDLEKPQEWGGHSPRLGCKRHRKKNRKYKRIKSLLSAPLCVCVCVIQLLAGWKTLRYCSAFLNALQSVIKTCRSATLWGSRHTSATYQTARDEVWDLSYCNTTTCYRTRGTEVRCRASLSFLTCPSVTKISVVGLTWHCRDRVSSCNIYAVQQDTQCGLNE